MAIYWTENFEGTLSNWIDYGLGHNFQLTTSNPGQGSQSLRMPYPNGGFLDRFTGVKADQFNFRFLTRIGSNWVAGSGGKIFYIRADTSPAVPHVDAWIGTDVDNLPNNALYCVLQRSYDTMPPHCTFPPCDTQNIYLNCGVSTSWKEFEFEWILNTPGQANGSMRFWETVNGTPVLRFSQTGRQYRGPTQDDGALTYIDNLRLYIQAGIGDRFVDALTVGNSRIGTGEPVPDPEPTVTLDSLTPSSASIASSDTQQFLISMSGPVPSSVSVSTSSSNQSVATVPSSVTVNAGSATGLLTATAVASGSTTITASYEGEEETASLEVYSLISDVSVSGAGNGLNRYIHSPTTYTWVSGTPTASATNTPTGIFTDGTLTFTVHADTTERILRVYGGCLNTPSMRLQASLSDSSATAYTDVGLSSTLTESSTNAVWVLRYKAGSANQTLTVALSLTAGNATQGSIAIQAATLQLANQPAEDMTLSPSAQTIQEGATGFLTLTLNPARTTPSVVMLAVSDDTKISVPASITIPANTSSIAAQIIGIDAGSSTVTATLGDHESTSTVTVIDVPLTVPTPALNLYTSFLDVYRWM